MEPVAGLDQLRRHPDPVAGTAHRTLQNVSDVEQLADFPEVLVLPLECERRSTAGHLKVIDLRENIEQLLRQALGKIRMIAIGRQVLERQHRDGLLYRCDRLLCCRAIRLVEIQPVEPDDGEYGNEHSYRRNVQLAAGIARNRFAAIDVFLALYAFRREFVCPGKNQCDGEPEQAEHKQELQDPLGRSRDVQSQLCNLQNQPPGDQVSNGDSEHVSPL